MSSTVSKESPKPMTPGERRRLDTLKKLAKMDPAKREQLLRLERLRRGLPMVIKKSTDLTTDETPKK